MRKKQAPQSESKRRLLDAAGRLFAEHGFDRIAIRDVSKAAEANVAAVNYHFGSRQNLVELVVAQHILPVLDERSARFEALEKRPAAKAAPVEEVLDAFARPVFGCDS
jgi:AcrR family transcriptional regulator